jgi:hypothetical protein
MPPVGFEPIIPASEQPQTHALDRAAAGIGNWKGSSTGNLLRSSRKFNPKTKPLSARDMQGGLGVGNVREERNRIRCWGFWDVTPRHG